LVLTLMFVVGTGVMLGALLTYANTAINTAKATQGRHQLSADVSGAMDVAINELRKSTYADSTQPCPTTVPANVPGADGKPIRIVCLPKVGSGTSAGTVPINKVNHPGAAVLTLAPIQVAPGQTEAGLTKSDNSRLRIKGGVYVNSNIDASGSGTTCQDLQSANCTAIDVEQAGVLAKGSCLPAARVVATTAPYTVSCSVAGTAKASDPLLKDPALLTDTDLPHGTAIAAGYAQPPSTIDKLGLQVVPTLCPPVGQAVELNPGYYDDAVALTDLTSTCNRAFHFAPGVYYFDFRNEEMAGIAAGSRPIGWSNNVKNVWTINNGSADFYVVGGTTKDWSAGKPTTFPGSCVSPLTSTANNEGVQFVFGGSSRIDLQQGQVELCGQYSLDRPALVLYGAKTGTTIQQALRASTPTAVAPSSAFVSTPPGAELQRLSSVDGALATAPITRAASGTTTATVRLTGMDAASQIPPGSILTTAELRVTHKETTASSSDALAVSVLPNPGRTGTAPVASTGTATISGTMTTQTTDLKNALMKEVWRNGLSNVQIDYSVIAAQATVPLPKLTADLDAAQLYLAWTPPSLRGQTTAINGANCVGAVPPATTCPLLQTKGVGGVSLYLQGTTYAPLATFALNLVNVNGQVMKSGIIARSLSVSVNPSTSFTQPVIEIPDETAAGVTMEVYLVAYQCTGTATECASSAPPASGWRLVGRSTIALDSEYPVPTDGTRQVTVTNWHVLD